MTSQFTPAVKDKVWHEYAKTNNAKKELKNIFLGNKPTETYYKINEKLKKELIKHKNLSTKTKSQSKKKNVNSPNNTKSLSNKKNVKAKKSSSRIKVIHIV